MNAKKEMFPFRRGWRYVYTLNPMLTRKDAMLFAIEVFRNLPFENKVLRVEDGLTSDDGTRSADFREVENPEWFLSQYLQSPVYLMMIFGRYQAQRIIVSVHLDRSKIVISCHDRVLIEEIAKMLQVE